MQVAVLHNDTAREGACDQMGAVKPPRVHHVGPVSVPKSQAARLRIHRTRNCCRMYSTLASGLEPAVAAAVEVEEEDDDDEEDEEEDDDEEDEEEDDDEDDAGAVSLHTSSYTALKSLRDVKFDQILYCLSVSCMRALMHFMRSTSCCCLLADEYLIPHAVRTDVAKFAGVESRNSSSGRLALNKLVQSTLHTVAAMAVAISSTATAATSVAPLDISSVAPLDISSQRLQLLSRVSPRLALRTGASFARTRFQDYAGHTPRYTCTYCNTCIDTIRTRVVLPFM